MDIRNVQQLMIWMREADLLHLELERPGGSLLLRRSPRTAASPAATRFETATSPAATPANSGGEHLGGEIVRADTVGQFLIQHPLRETPLVRQGDRVDAGDLLGLLRIGSLYLPVRAHVAGRVSEPLTPPGGLVGYGAPLFALDNAD
ncbi:acetyl-CoA carboxylase biotin carboxyl carrier protein [Halotalea alkalilenta]|uniref:Lipoyl-binding domain-containing protein n=1 Tax=Halotalea alkalilenta TaxID=376489 RepID=A0A172YGJ2_9GAMM|nr:acetyl-CoA carboxylase biotin carboxyl carrier protein subunit [Halotalea alkalilenta]ANF58172.1 hypothetical protein A5892_12430 [Halotalea alkalilenta]